MLIDRGPSLLIRLLDYIFAPYSFLYLDLFCLNSTFCGNSCEYVERTRQIEEQFTKAASNRVQYEIVVNLDRPES